MIYNFTQIEDKGTHIKLSTSDGDSVSIPKDKFISIDDESGLVSIKTVGSRATIGTISEAIYEYEFKPAGEKEVVLLLQNGTVERHTYNGIIPKGEFANRTDIAEAKIGDYITSYEAGGSGNRAFYNCTNLSKIEFGSGLTTLPNGVCEGCTSLTDVIIPEGVLQTGVATFKGCTSLTSVDLPESIEVIGDPNGSWSETFMWTALSSITIPQSVTRMMIDVFRYCDDLQYIELLPTTPPTIYNNTFNGIPSTCIFYVPSESVEAYKAASGWSTYANRIQAIP